MCQNLDIRFLRLYCLFVSIFLFLFIRPFSLFFMGITAREAPAVNLLLIITKAKQNNYT
jgi:hypothetical protein